MIGGTLTFLRRDLDAYLRAEMADGLDAPTADKVVFVDGDQLDPLGFKEEAVSQLLINVQEERLLRAADPYLRTLENGQPGRGQPDLRLILHILFAARFKQYESAWEHLSKIIEYMQSNRLIDSDSHPALPESVEKLTIELISLDLAEQNNVWNALRASYLPSILYRVGLVVLRDVKATAQHQITQPVSINVRGGR